MGLIKKFAESIERGFGDEAVRQAKEPVGEPSPVNELSSPSTEQRETIPLSASPNGLKLDTSEMSNAELLRRTEFNTRKTSEWAVRIYWLIFIAILVGPLIQQTVIGILVSIGLANQ